MNDRDGYIPAIISVKSVSPSLMIAKFENIIIAIKNWAHFLILTFKLDPKLRDNYLLGLYEIL